MNDDEPITDAELDAMAQRANAASKPPWQSFVEGRDHIGGGNFIRIGGLDDNEPDMYVSHDTPQPATPTSTSSPSSAKTFHA
jgi:hypothetical protein